MKKTILAGFILFFTLLSLTTASVTYCAPMEIFVSISPQKWLSDQLGHDRVTTHILVGKGQDPHTYEPTPKQLTTLSRATLYFTLDLEFEKQIVPILQKTVPNLHLVDTAGAIPKIAMTSHEHKEPGHDTDDRHDNEGHGHNEQARTDGEQYQQGLDPHVWLSPLNLKIMAAAMAEAMMTHDPVHKVTYEQNLQAVNEILDRLYQEITQELAPFQGSSFYVFHPAFGYFAHAYHLQQQAIETGGKSPSPKQLSSLITKARESGTRVIFVQPQFDPKSAQAIANAINGEVVPLDPLAEDVAANLQIMAAKIKTALTTR